MLRVFRTQRQVFGWVVALTLLLALLPAGWPHTRWLRSVGDLVRMFTRPVEHVSILTVRWLRPVRIENPELPEDFREQLRLIETDRDAAITRARQFEQELNRLYEINDQLRIAAAGAVQSRLLVAPITGQSPSPSLQTVDVKVSRDVEVPIGTVAVYDGVHLMGKISASGKLSCEVTALTDRVNGWITARVLPRDRVDFDLSRAPRIQLAPDGDGRFIGDARADEPIHIDDEVRLDDSHWKATAQMMIIGYVESIDEKPENPLLRIIKVRPRHLLSELPHVVLKIPMEDQTP